MSSAFGNKPVGSASESCPLKQQPKPKPLHWIEIQLVGEDDKPVPWVEYQIALPNGDTARGYLDGNGKARVENIDQPGQAQVTFPGLDQDAWAPAGS